jgi:excisionase family DNA binding protein
MVASEDMTLQEAAEVLGVHYMTAYRYVRLGLLPAAKHGGSWRVSRADVEEIQSGGRGRGGADQPVDDTAPATVPRHHQRAAWAPRLESRLLAGDSRGSWGVVEAALAGGASLDDVYVDVLTPALVAIGEQWAAGKIDIAIEHRASGIAMRLIGRLGPRFVRRGRTRGGIVLGAPAGERHAIPVAIVADLLRQQGWDVSDLGADVPAPSFVFAAQATADLAAVGVSVTSPASLPAAAEALTALRAAVQPDVALVAGGRAVGSEEEARALGADCWASDGRRLVQVLEDWSTGHRGVGAAGAAD